MRSLKKIEKLGTLWVYKAIHDLINSTYFTLKSVVCNCWVSNPLYLLKNCSLSFSNLLKKVVYVY